MGEMGEMELCVKGAGSSSGKGLDCGFDWGVMMRWWATPRVRFIGRGIVSTYKGYLAFFHTHRDDTDGGIFKQRYKYSSCKMIVFFWCCDLHLRVRDN